MIGHGAEVGFVYFLTLLGMVVDLLRDFLNETWHFNSVTSVPLTRIQFRTSPEGLVRIFYVFGKEM